MNLGSNVANSATGPMIAASFACEKKADIKKEKVISDMQKKKKYTKSMTGSVAGKKELWHRKVALMAIHRNKKNAVRNHDSWCTESLSPMIFSTSLMRDSFSSTTDLTRHDIGYNVATVMSTMQYKEVQFNRKRSLTVINIMRIIFIVHNICIYIHIYIGLISQNYECLLVIARPNKNPTAV